MAMGQSGSMQWTGFIKKYKCNGAAHSDALADLIECAPLIMWTLSQGPERVRERGESNYYAPM